MSLHIVFFWKVSLIHVTINCINLMYKIRCACAIQFDEFVVVTGGLYTLTTVSVYNIHGWVEDLSDLNEGRVEHGCGHYVNNNQTIV